MSLLKGTMIPIYTVTVGAGGQAEIEFTNIPQTYSDLCILTSVRGNQNNGILYYIRFNQDSGANYSYRYILKDSTDGPISASGSSQSSMLLGIVGGATPTASTFSNDFLYIPNYTGNNFKSINADIVMENGSSMQWMSMAAGLWSSTAAINNIRIFPNTNVWIEGSKATLYGIKNYALTKIDEGAKASGGIVTSDANYWYHTFTTSGTFTPTQSLTADYLVIAGGAGGGTGNGGGGGGAGGFVYTSGDSLTSTSYTVTVGAGGAGATDGNSSIFRSSTALKGGRGGNSGGAGIGGSGTYGSGGGNGRDSGSSSGGAGTSGQGFAGGGPAIGSNANGGGGGGGAGGTGYPGKEDSSANNGGLGGIGISTYSSWGLATSTGENVSGTYYYAGGGGGSPVTGNALGGLGGGGRSATFNLSGSAATSGITASGGGGGGGGNTGNWSSVPGNGGSGVVIIRYAK